MKTSFMKAKIIIMMGYYRHLLLQVAHQIEDHLYFGSLMRDSELSKTL